MSKLLTEKEVEAIYGIKVRSLQKMRYTGQGPVYAKLGRSVRYRVPDIEQYIKEHLKK